MSDLGPMPEPTAEPREPEPGGADAVDYEERTAQEAEGRDLAPDENPAADDVPEEITEPDSDKQQAPDESAAEDPPSEPSA
jgi:hypothetical protein